MTGIRIIPEGKFYRGWYRGNERLKSTQQNSKIITCAHVHIHTHKPFKHLAKNTNANPRTNILSPFGLPWWKNYNLKMLIIWDSGNVGFPGGSEVKASACNVGDLGSIPGSGRFSGEGNGNPLQYSCQENPMDGGAWWATVHRVAKSQTRLSNFTSLHFRQCILR